MAICALATLNGKSPPVTRKHLRFYFWSGMTAIALPNLLINFSVPHLGAGITALAFAFPPLCTLLIGILLRVERPSLRRTLGIFLGGIGTLMVVLPKDGLPADTSLFWLGLILLVPVSLGIGNIYRSRAWPQGSAPLPLAAGLLLGAAVELLPFLPFGAGQIIPPDLSTGVYVAVAMTATTAGYAMFLELQRLSGPLYLSQAGYVVTMTGLLVATGVLGEHVSPWVWAAAAMILSGVAITNRA